MKVAQSFPHSTRSIKEARSFATDELIDLEAGVRGEVVLLVSELATNAVRHAASGFRITIERIGAEIRVGVTDSGGGTPLKRPVDPQETSGRGLQLVEKFSQAWGVDEDPPHAKTVWFTVRHDERSTRAS